MYVAGGVGFEANLFCTVLSCGEVDFCELRSTSFAFPYCGCSPLGEVGVVDLGGKFGLYGALLDVKLISVNFEAHVSFTLAVGALFG